MPIVNTANLKLAAKLRDQLKGAGVLVVSIGVQQKGKTVNLQLKDSNDEGQAKLAASIVSAFDWIIDPLPVKRTEDELLIDVKARLTPTQRQDVLDRLIARELRNDPTLVKRATGVDVSTSRAVVVNKK